MGAPAPPHTTRGPMPRPVYRGFRGSRLREFRERAGLTQDRLAIALSVYPTMVGKWEREEVAPRTDNVARLSQVLDVRPQEFTDVPPEDGSLVDLRVWSGRSRRQAAAAAGIPESRLLGIEHLTHRPTPAIAGALAGLYGVDRDLILAAWERDRAAITPQLASGS